ncbi:VIR protein [Plasmodium vivax]|uniref:VIR protein n=1 Tax=Plasmodium vivax TaxID=5855 RepID=A0A1G4E441_PLAVI|nr:VIR protein [Plasmodium vivax]
MSDNILDIKILREEYPFLNTIWDTYNQFDKPVDGDPYKNMYEILCNHFMMQRDRNQVKHKNFCLKLVRNLGFYSLNTEFFNPSFERCNILYYWIYNSVKNQKISNDLINYCFDDYKYQMSSINRTPKCHYHSYEDNYNDPVKMIILESFQYNMKDVRDIVSMENTQPDFRVQKYICECVKIYKEMNRENCAKSNEESEKSIKTCEKLNIFKNTYKSFLSTTEQKNYEIPSLDNVEAEYLTMCTQDKSRSKLTRQGYGTVFAATSLNGGRDGDTDGMSSYEGAKINAEDSFTSSTDVHGENQNSPTSSTVSTVVGTVAGASSILALLYKFSPARRWVHSGIRGNSGRMNSNFYEGGPTELLIDRYEGRDMSSYNAQYNVGYGSV